MHLFLFYEMEIEVLIQPSRDLVALAGWNFQNFLRQATGTLLIYLLTEEEAQINTLFTPGTSNVSLDDWWLQPMHCVFLKLVLHEATIYPYINYLLN